MSSSCPMGGMTGYPAAPLPAALRFWRLLGGPVSAVTWSLVYSRPSSSCITQRDHVTANEYLPDSTGLWNLIEYKIARTELHCDLLLMLAL